MAYRTRVYVCFDGDEDMRYYQLLNAWDSNENIDFDFNNAHQLTDISKYEEENIKRHLRERLKRTKLMLVLVGEKTKNLYKYVRWEMEIALDMDIPIVAVNLNKKNRMDEGLCPPILKGKTVIHIPYSKDNIKYAIETWPKYYDKSKEECKIDLYWKHMD